MKTRFRYYFTIAKLLFIILVPPVLLLLPADFFDHGRSLCLSQLLFGVECPACGLTRGIMHLIHLDLENAFAYNMMSFIILPLMCVVWVQWYLKERRMLRRLKAKLAAANPPAATTQLAAATPPAAIQPSGQKAQ